MEYLTIVILEQSEVVLHIVEAPKSGEVKLLYHTNWDPSKALNDKSGLALIEETCSRIHAFWKDKNVTCNGVLISLPGTVKSEYELISSSRLGILEELKFSEKITYHLNVPCYIFHDTECLGIGEITFGNHFKDEIPNSVIYAFVDEGIGSKIFIKGKPFLGAGTAGLLGRLIVEPEGIYSPALKSSGTLEAYSSRPWVSKKMVEIYNSEIDKKYYGVETNKTTTTKYRQALKTASESGSDQISYDRMISGLKDNDPIALTVVDQASKYLGFSLNSVITILNPNLIILGGGMITQLPEFANKTINYARQFSWKTGWNNTNISISLSDRNIQVLGAIILYRNLTK